MTVAERLAVASRVLAAADVEAPRREARLLLAYAAGLDQAALLRDLHSEVAAPAFDGLAFDAIVQRRAAREPLALITGRQGFWSLDLAVSADTLIPRADSEAVVEAALASCGGRAVRRVLDLGSGTGCLLLALLTELPGASGVGIDRAAGAARLAARNAAAVGLAGSALFVCGDWAGAIDARFDLVVSNPPYVPVAAIAGLMPEVAQYEPWNALDGGVDGLDAYRAITAQLPDLLAPDGSAVLELGAGQAAAVAAIAAAHGLAVCGMRDDLAGVERAMVLRAARLAA